MAAEVWKMIGRGDAFDYLRQKIHDENLTRHMLSVASVMQDLALKFGEDADLWFITGLLHDIDLGETTDPSVHGLLGSEWLSDLGLSEESCHAVRVHAGHGQPEDKIDIALIAGDQITGLIVACALVKGRKLANVTTETVLKRFKEKRFAAGADRNSIMMCEQLGLTLHEFTALALKSMQSIALDLGL